MVSLKNVPIFCATLQATSSPAWTAPVISATFVGAATVLYWDLMDRPVRQSLPVARKRNWPPVVAANTTVSR